MTVAFSHPVTDTCLMTGGYPVCYARYMSVSEQELLHHLSRMPLVDMAKLAMITGEARVAVNRGRAAGAAASPAETKL